MKSKILSLSKQILIAIANNASEAFRNGAECAPHHGFNRLIFGDTLSFTVEEKYRQQQQIKRVIRELKKRKFIIAKQQGEKLVYALTAKGTNELFLAKIKAKIKKKNYKKFCIVCFDIPVAANDVRWALKRFLKLAGFQKLQQSVWYTNQDIFQETQEYIKNLKAKNWIRTISAFNIQ